MAENTGIQWADHTFNPWEGCTKVGAGCDHCYAEVRNARFAGGESINWGAGAPRRRTSVSNWNLPRQWNATPFYRCTACGWRGKTNVPHEVGALRFFQCPHCEGDMLPARQRVFCASLADVFDNEVDPAWRADLFKLIEETPHLDWLLLTKRIGNVLSMVEGTNWPLKNVWLGATIVNQLEAGRDIPKLLNVPAAVRFLSIEPLLDSINLNKVYLSTDHARWVDWVIVGGESGAGARPMHPNWVRSLRDQCASAGVPFLFKQWGEYLPATNNDDGSFSLTFPADTKVANKLQWVELENNVHMAKVGKKAAGRTLDNKTYDGYPLLTR